VFGANAAEELRPGSLCVGQRREQRVDFALQAFQFLSTRGHGATLAVEGFRQMKCLRRVGDRDKPSWRAREDILYRNLGRQPGGTLAAELRPDIQAAKDRLRIRLGVGREGTITIFASANNAEVENVNNDEPARTSSR
jgi:hypothetical protein